MTVTPSLPSHDHNDGPALLRLLFLLVIVSITMIIDAAWLLRQIF